MAPIIVWFRQDLRLADNPALHFAAACGRPVLCLYVLDDETPGRWRPGGAARWWLHGSLDRLATALARANGILILRRGDSRSVIREVVNNTGAAAVAWNRCYEPHAIARDATIKAELASAGIAVDTFDAALLAEPFALQTKAGTPFRVFTPFWKALRVREIARPLPPPDRIALFKGRVASDRLADWGLTPTAPDWAGGLRAAWQPGERHAVDALRDFLANAETYPATRDRLDMAATSRLSPHLHWGEVSPRQVWHAVRDIAPTLSDGGEKFLSELAWREFSHHLLFHSPALPETPLDEKFANLPWAEDEAGFTAWSRGRTGIPIVDAGMRELWTTGWMHNRARMVAASFLIKHLLIDWRRGQDWFWDTLVDADLANNSASWQWVAGCGADAAPWFRIFNPVLQGRKFDPVGGYVRHFVPELAQLPPRHIHAPWEAPQDVLRAAGVRLGANYPNPVVDLAAGRARALAAFAALKSG